jgi:hypothetical protein
MKESKIKVEFRDPKSLTPYSKNAKVHSIEQIDKIAGQIASFGFDQPIVVDKDFVIIKGHGRREAAIRLNLQEVPIVVADHLDEYQAMAARIADNKVADAPWDVDMLKFDLGTLKTHDFDLKLTGFDMPALKSFVDSGEVRPEIIGGSIAHADTPRAEPAPVSHVTPPAEQAQEPKPEATGSTEYSPEQFDKFDHKCPRCGFEFNEKEEQNETPEPTDGQVDAEPTPQ